MSSTTTMDSTKKSSQDEPVAALVEKIPVKVPQYLSVIGMDPRKFWPKKYRFTRECIPGQLNPLTTSQRNFYESNGYMVMDKTITPKLLEEIKQQYYANWRGQNQHLTPTNLIEPKLMERFSTSTNLLAYVGCFTDERILLMSSSLINSFKVKHPNPQQKDQDKSEMDPNKKTVNNYEDLWSNKSVSNGDQQSQPTLLAASVTSDQQAQQNTTVTFENSGYQFLYRDWMYLPFRPLDKIVCTVTAIEPIDQVLLVVPGTHRVGQCTIGDDGQMNEVYESAPANMRTLIESAKKQSKYINLKPGQTLFYNPGLIHGYSNDLVYANKTYLAVISYYAAGDCKYINYEPSQNLLDHKNLPIPAGLAEFGPNKNPMDHKSWLGKARMVRESPLNL